MFVKYFIIVIILLNFVWKIELVFFVCLFFFFKESVLYLIESLLLLFGFNIINMDVISGIMIVKVLFWSGLNNFY